MDLPWTYRQATENLPAGYREPTVDLPRGFQTKFFTEDNGDGVERGLSVTSDRCLKLEVRISGQRQLFFSTGDNYNLPGVWGKLFISCSGLVLGLPLGRNGVLGAARRQGRSGAQGADGCLSLPLFGILCADTFATELQDQGVMD